MRQIPEKIDSKFRFVLLAATRAEQIMRGAQHKTPGSSKKFTRVAMDEIFDETVGWEYGPEAAEEPLLEGVEEAPAAEADAGAAEG